MAALDDIARALIGDDDPFEAAARRQRNAVRPAGGRPEGEITNLIAELLPNTYRYADNLAERAVRSAQQHSETGDYNPAPFVETAVNMIGVGGPAAMAGLSGDFGAAGGKGIRAYHGSPHNFDKFDLSKIGTGEGAQAYGHGLYFAGNENVARQYRDQLAKDMFYSPTGRMFDPQSQLQHMNIRVAARNNGTDLDATIARALQLGDKNTPPATRAMIEHDLNVLRGFKDEGGIAKNPGHMYEVNINAAPEQLLDWDNPLHGQSRQIQEAIAKIDQSALKPAPKMSEIKDMEIRNIVREALRQNQGNAKELSLMIDNDSRLYSAAVNHARSRGIDLEAKDMRASDYVYDQSQDFLNKLLASQEHTGEALHRTLGTKGVDKMEQAPVAEMLRGAGIPGIQYLDQGSRGTGAGTKNYVVFDDKIIDILRKYGISAPLLGALMQPSEQ